MKKQTFFRSTLCLLLTLLCNVAWAEKIQPSTKLPDQGGPEHVYTMMNGNNVYVNGLTAPTQTEANYGQFAFYAVDGVEGAYYIYSHTAEKWLTYTKAASYNNGKDFVKMADAKEADDYFHVENYSGDFYQIRPYNTTGVAGKYLNWFQGVGGNPYDGSNTLGLWQDNATNDAGSRYSFTEVIVVVRTYTIDILGGANGQTIKIGDETYKDGDTYTIEGSVNKGDITVVAPEGQFAAVAINDAANTINVYFATLPTQPTTVAYTNAVLYPAQQEAVGTAKIEEKGGVYTLSNNVLAASFMRLGDAIYFAGSKAMDLVAGTEPFTVAFGAGDNVAASAMTLKSLEVKTLEANPNAVGGVEHFAGKALVANYEYTYKESTVAIVWRAVLRDGSHYLRTEMELTGVDDVDMFNIIPMIYNVDTKAAGSTPAVVGNTRGAVLMSNKIFAGLETPTAYNTVGGATGEEDNWNLTTTLDAVSLAADSWVQLTQEEAEAVKRVEEATGATYPNLLAYKQTGVELKKGQKIETKVEYKTGAHRLNFGGADLVAANGDIVASDYHSGYSGSQHDKNVFTITAPADGTYTIRVFVQNKSESIDATSTLTTKIYTAKEGVVINTDIVGIQGRWSRNTNLAAGETWKVGAVVGLIAQDGTQAEANIHKTQKRRSFLAYSERERAVPWRTNPVYISWYELNINRNNAAPGSEPSNMNEGQVLDVLAHWKSDFYDRYGIAPNMFVIDDGWDEYGEWLFHDGFPNEMDVIADKAWEMDGAGVGAWLGPVGGYGESGNYRRAYWNGKGGMQLSNPDYYAAFKKAATNLVKNQGDNKNYTFFKFDGISAQFSAVGPDGGDTGNENAEGIIRLERFVREELREDIFFNTTVGTWASPFWYQITDATWRQENDHGRVGDNSINRENWITYRDELVYRNYVTNSPICPINTLMTHGFILTKFGPPAGDSRDYTYVRNELRSAFLCGSGMVELYNDYDLMNSINGGALWADLAECIAWQKRNADVLPDAHWVGGNPWTGSKAEVYGWAAWNGTKSSLALRNGGNDAQTFTFTLRSALNIPANVKGSIILRSAFGDQDALEGLTEGKAYGIDETITVTLPGSSVYGFEGIDANVGTTEVNSIALTAENNATEVAVNNTLVIKAAVNADATFPALAWSSSNPEVATVVAGFVKPLKEGTVTITATAKDGSNEAASVTITVTPKPIDMDAPVVTDLKQLSNDKVYTLSSTRAFLFYRPESNKVVSSTGTAVGSVTLDKTNPNHQFRIEKKGDNYYLYSVGAEKYVAKDGTYVTTATDALTLSDVSANRPNYPWQLALGGNGMNSQAGGQTAEGIVFNSYNTTDDGNCYKIEVGVPKTYEYTIHVLGATGATVTYNGEEYQDGDTFEPEGEYTASDFAASAVEGKVSVVNIDGYDVFVSYWDNTTQFYTIRGGHGGYVSLAEGYHDNGRLKLTNMARIKDKQGLWAFVKDGDGAYTIYNFSTGLSKVLGMKGDGSGAQARMVAPTAADYTKAFDGSIKFDGTASFIKLKGSANNYWNRNGGTYLALWNSTAATDQGSQFFMTAVDFNNFVDVAMPVVPETKEELAADKIKGVTSFTPDNANTLWYKTSAQASGVSYPWMEYALPLGNGELGCMVFGGVLKEELQFNEKTLWSGRANVIGADGGKRTFMNFGSVFVKNLDETLEQGVTDYVRYLDIEEGIAGVKFTNANGTKQERKYLSSAPDQVIAGQYKSENGTMHLLFKLEAEAEIDADYVIYKDGMASFSGYMEAVNYAARLHVEAKDGEVITTDAGIEVKNATEVTFYLKGGTNFDGDMTHITSYFTTATPAQVNANVKSEIEKAATKGFEAVETAHVANFKEITERMTLDLGLTTPTVDTKTLIDNYYPNNTDGTSTSNDHLFLEQLYFHYGRYLAISSNRKNIAAPNNLQGIWNDRASDSPWNSDIHTNINIQMNYWPTEITNLSDLHKPFVNFIIRGAQTEGWKNISKTYNNNGPGWSILTETSLYGSMSTWGAHYLVANVWYTSHLWMHYRYTQDKEFLKEAFPVMWGAAEFWFHRLIEDRGFDNTKDEQNSVKNYHTPYKYEPDGTYVAPNEFSAEQHDNEREDGTAHAQQMIYYLFTNLKEAIDILGGKEAVGLTDEDIAKLDKYLAKTDQGLHTEVYTGAWGETYNGVKTGEPLLREWKYTPFDISNDKGHRHMSHLMALFPMDQITPESPYFEPAVNSMKLRGDDATGWSMGWKVNLWARAQDGDHAHIIIKNALKHSTSYGTNAGAGGIYYNLFDAHAPFQIDGNFGVCSGIAEMLLQSAHGYINILPALPAVWERTGAVTGMKAIGNFTVDFNWQDGKAQKVTITSHKGAPLKVRCNRGAMDIADAFVTVNGTEVAAQVDENGIATIPNVKEGDKVVIDFTKRRSVAVKVYTPGKRATTLEAGKKYFIYNTAFNNGTEDRTGFLFDNGAGMGHTKKKPFGANLLKTTDEAYLWEVVATETAGQYYIKAADGGYVSASGKTDNASAQILYIQPWPTTTATKSSVSSEDAEGTVVANANIGADVFTIHNGNTCWNGNASSFATWSDAHPYAFYEVAEDAVMLSDAFPLPGKTYYIYCDNDTRQYFYNDGGTLKVSEKRTEWSNEYLFTCSFDGTCFQFKNAKGKYLKHQGLQDAAHNFELAEYLDGVNLKTPGLSSGYFVMKNDNTFSQANRGDYDPATTDFSTVYKFEEFNFPVDGETYYIYSDTYYNDEYVNRYMYADGSNLKLNTSLSVTDAYKWTCKVTDDGYVQFQNGAGKYLKHKGVQDTPYNFTLNKYNANHAIAATLYSVADSRYFVVKNNGAEFNQSTGTYNQTSGDWCSDFVFMPVNDVKILTVNGSNKADDATATWNGETKTLPATWIITPQTTITDATLSVNGGANYKFNGLFENGAELGETAEISDFETNHTITAKLTPSFFSASTNTEDLVAVRIRNVRNNKYTLRLNASDNYTGHTVNTGETAYGENEIWYLVGTDESFKIYSRVAGMGLHVVLAGTGGGSAASMNTTDTNADFCLVAKDNGYAICPKANTGQSFNMHGGAGADIKLYGAGDGGSVWIIEKMDVNKPLTLNVTIDQVWESSPRVAELTLTIGGIAGQTRILGNVEGQQLFIPLGANYEVSSMTYRGYTYNGCTDVEGVLTASYAANEERTLFYSPRDGHPYRIPAIATAPNGDIFAICDYRPCGNDIGYGEVDLVCRVSSDNGVTWTEERTIADGLGHINDGIWKMGFGDPAIVADRESNKVLVMSVCGNRTCWDGNYGDGGENENPNRVSRLYIEHDGEKWVYGEPEEVTYDIYPLFANKNGGEAHVASMFIGAGKICQSRVVKKGEYYRLYCSVWAVTKSIRTHHNYVIYSDDFGLTWNVLGGVGNDANPNQPGPAFGGNEPKCEELPDGTVVLSSRKGGGRYFNLFTFDNEGKSEEDMYTTGSWGTCVSSNDIAGGLSFGGNSTNGEIYKVKAIRKSDGQICDIMLQSIPTGGGRDNVAIYYKEMEYNEDGTNKYTPETFATGWTKGIHVSTKGSCYSTMISQADGRIAFFFEEEPSGYCMVYIPYTIEELTGDAYSLYTVNSTIGQYEIGTFYASEAMQIPEGVKAYVATEQPEMKGADAEGNATGVITMTELEGIIPAHTGAVLRGKAATYKFIPSISYGTAVEDNMLIGYEANNKDADLYREESLADGYTTYVLTVKDKKAGFYRKEAGFKVYNNKAYLQVPATIAANSLAIRFEGDGTTSIDNEQLTIDNESTAIYDLMGRRVTNPTKGVYIVDGKKVVIK